MARTMVDRFEQRQQTRAKLVEAALELFATSGYEHATVDDIAKAAGYSKGAYYFHFSTKDDILLELVRLWAEDRTNALARADGEDLRATLTSFFSYGEQSKWRSVLLEFWSQALRNAEVNRRVSSAYSSWRKQIAACVETAVSRGDIAPVSAEETAATSLAMHDGYAVQLAVGWPGGTPMTPQELADAVVTPLEAETAAEDRGTIAI